MVELSLQENETLTMNVYYKHLGDHPWVQETGLDQSKQAKVVHVFCNDALIQHARVRHCISLIWSQTPSIQVHSSNEKSNGDERVEEHEGPEVAAAGSSQSSPGIAVEQRAAAKIQKAFRSYRIIL
ncbi:protein IQ-DOMAIN 1-like isoform X1 [Gossypium australe]|uniref:Protein IQ-DOMAIN 1-like isoform X1 n=1 Tax=Gossypium australe TaxID=47621 RepID=A0A5B6VF63_9ROSI|nr:protein IQ-DOMAIN 1-like isoform X1 [Gossypium australe]